MTARADVPVAGGTLATYSLGSDPPRVLAVHGVTATHRAWVAVARALGGDVTLVAPDIRGRGASNGLPEPYGIAAHARDMLAVLDHFNLERTLLVGHSLGAYIAARVAAGHPERVSAVVLVDGGLTLPLPADADPQEVQRAVLGPALTRLQMTFASRQAYRAWWRGHPAFADSDVDDEVLGAYADYDLIGVEPELRSGISQEAVRGDGADLFVMGEPAHRLTVPATMLCAPRGLQDEPNPLQPLPLVEQWVAEAPAERRFQQVPDVNHYTLVMGRRGAHAVAQAVREALNYGSSSYGKSVSSSAPSSVTYTRSSSRHPPKPMR